MHAGRLNVLQLTSTRHRGTSDVVWRRNTRRPSRLDASLDRGAGVPLPPPFHDHTTPRLDMIDRRRTRRPGLLARPAGSGSARVH